MIKTSLLTLLVIVTFVAFALAAFTYSNAIWRRITFTTVLALLLFSILISIVSRRSHRWFWLGFAISGCLYFGMVFWDQDWNFDESVLLTDSALEFIHETTGWGTPRITPDRNLIHLNEDDVSIVAYPRNVGLAPEPKKVSYAEAERLGYLPYGYSIEPPNWDDFHDIGHLVWVVIIGMAGGALTFWMRKRFG